MKNLKNYIFAIMLLSITACDVINPEEPIPSYIHIENFTVTSTVGQGTSDSKIVDGFLYINNEFLGIYELPKTIPIIATGSTSIIVDSGIRDNGISGTPEIYPFYTRYTTSVDLVQGEEVTISPSVEYKADANFAYVEDFELDNTVTFDADEDSLTLSTLTTIGAYSGRSLKFSVTEDSPHSEIGSNERFKLPTDGNISYLEMHYKNDSFLEVGLIGYLENSDTPLKFLKITLNPQSDWNKIYINLTDDLISSDLFEYQLLFAGNLPAGVTEASFYLDNLKLIHQ